MQIVKMYTTAVCPYCIRAKRKSIRRSPMHKPSRNRLASI